MGAGRQTPYDFSLPAHAPAVPLRVPRLPRRGLSFPPHLAPPRRPAGPAGPAVPHLTNGGSSKAYSCKCRVVLPNLAPLRASSPLRGGGSLAPRRLRGDGQAERRGGAKRLNAPTRKPREPHCGAAFPSFHPMTPVMPAGRTRHMLHGPRPHCTENLSLWQKRKNILLPATTSKFIGKVHDVRPHCGVGGMASSRTASTRAD